MCFWISLVGTRTDCSSDEFWLNASGELIEQGVIETWAGGFSMYRMAVARGEHGEVLSYAPSLSTQPVTLDWYRAAGDEDPFTPELVGGPTEFNPTNNSWSINVDAGQYGIITVQPNGSRTSTVISIGDYYTAASYEVIWA